MFRLSSIHMVLRCWSPYNGCGNYIFKVLAFLLGIGPRAACMLSWSSTTVLHSSLWNQRKSALACPYQSDRVPCGLVFITVHIAKEPRLCPLY